MGCPVEPAREPPPPPPPPRELLSPLPEGSSSWGRLFFALCRRRKWLRGRVVATATAAGLQDAMSEASATVAASPAPLPVRPGSSLTPARTYSLRPAFLHKFRSSTVKECLREVLKEELTGVQYSPDDIPQLTKSLSETIRDRLKEKGFQRYKIMVQVVIGEQRGEGVNMAARCFWDADTDNYAHDVFMNDSLFCVVVAFGCFFY